MKKTLTLIIMLSVSFSLSAEIAIPKGIIKITPRIAPTLSLENMDGEKFSLSIGKQRWSFVHFWASWCGPCRREMPTIQAVTQDMAKDNIDFVIVNTAESEDTVFSFLGAVSPDINTLLDRDGLVTEQWQPRGLPSTYLVDPNGKIQYVVIGGQDWEKPLYQNFLRQLSQFNVNIKKK